MTYDRVKKSSWTPPAKTTSSFFPQTHIQTKKETKPSWEVTGVHTTKEAMERIRRSMFGSVEPIVEAPKETAPQEPQQVQNPTPVSEEAVNGEIQAQPETGLSHSLGNGVSSEEAREGIQGRMFAQEEQTPVQKQEGTSPPTPLRQGEGRMEDAGGEAKGLAETEISLPIQGKLTIGEPNDKYEQEADRVARQVVDKIHSPTPETVQREEMGDEDEVRLKSEAGSGGKVAAGVGVTAVRKSPIAGVKVNRKVNSEGETQEASAQLEASIQGKRGSGQPLDESVKEPMEREFGADFSGVRVHTDGKSDELNQAIQAKAFTTGEDIFFREGAYEPGSKGGQELLAHELTHVVQQNQLQEKPLTPKKGEAKKRQPAMKQDGKWEETKVTENRMIIQHPVNLITPTKVIQRAIGFEYELDGSFSYRRHKKLFSEENKSLNKGEVIADKGSFLVTADEMPPSSFDKKTPIEKRKGSDVEIIIKEVDDRDPKGKEKLINTVQEVINFLDWLNKKQNMVSAFEFGGEKNIFVGGVFDEGSLQSTVGMNLKALAKFRSGEMGDYHQKNMKKWRITMIL